MTASRPFRTLPRDHILHERETAYAIRDGLPVSPGHTLIIFKRHVASFVDVTDAERADLMSLLGNSPVSTVSLTR